MTKIKNTKKGMAKKTLSMSLVVAMLATSNVPVWAAEFSDGSDVSVETEAPTAEEFSDATEAAQVADDAETPAIEDNTESVAVATAASDFNFTGITVNEKAKNPTWDEKGDTTTGKVAFTSQIFSGSIGGFANNKLQYAWAYNGTFSETDLTPMSAATVNSVTMPEASVLKAHVGETISLLFVETGTTTPIAKIELGTVQKVDISKTGFALNAITGETYNGAKHEPVITDASFATAPGGVTTYQVNGQETLNKAANYTWGYAGTDGLVNAKSKVTVTGTYVGVDADKYTGTMTTTFEIDKLALNATGNDFIIKAATPGKEFSYTGNTTQEVDKSEVNVYLADAKDTGAKTFSAKNVTITNATYAGGVTVKPGSVVKDPKTGAVLTEGKDYELVFDSKKVDVTSTPIEVEVKGLGQYKGTSVKTKTDGKKLTFIIEKKDLKDCSVSVDKNLKLTVMNGNVLETKENFTVKDNGDGTATVSVVDGGKNYTGSVNVEIGGRKVGAPMISNVKVVGNKATVILSDDVESASGYDYVISTDKDCITNKDYAAVNKNQAKTTTAFKYIDKGTYYAYCHAWTRDANGKKVFGEWSNGFQFSVTATTPDAPVITDVKVSGSTIKVTYRPAANATGYDVVLGTSSKKDNGELRPYNYGAHKKLDLKEGTVTATFKNVPKGTWTVGMHAFNRTSIDNKKVFSPWSNLETAKVK